MEVTFKSLIVCFIYHMFPSAVLKTFPSWLYFFFLLYQQFLLDSVCQRIKNRLVFFFTCQHVAHVLCTTSCKARAHVRAHQGHRANQRSWFAWGVVMTSLHTVWSFAVFGWGCRNSQRLHRAGRLVPSRVLSQSTALRRPTLVLLDSGLLLDLVLYEPSNTQVTKINERHILEAAQPSGRSLDTLTFDLNKLGKRHSRCSIPVSFRLIKVVFFWWDVHPCPMLYYDTTVFSVPWWWCYSWTANFFFFSKLLFVPKNDRLQHSKLFQLMLRLCILPLCLFAII